MLPSQRQQVLLQYQSYRNQFIAANVVKARQQHRQQQQLKQLSDDTAALTLRQMLADAESQRDAALQQQPAKLTEIAAKLTEIAASCTQADSAAAVRRDAAVQNALQQHDRDVADAHAAAAQRREEARAKLEELDSKVVAIRAQLDEAGEAGQVAGSAAAGQVAGSAAAGPSATSEAECPICLDRPKSIVFQCGHQACEVCAASINCDTTSAIAAAPRSRTASRPFNPRAFTDHWRIQ